VDKREREDQTPESPSAFPESPPPSYPSTQHSWEIQGIFELNKAVAKLERSVEHLETSVKEQRTDIRAVRTTLNKATGAFWIISVLLTIFGLFFGTKLWNLMMRIEDLSRRPPQAQAVTTDQVVPPPGFTLDPTPVPPPGFVPEKRPPRAKPRS
jgi:hypothetical protein